jgi:peptidoglycan/xylan/chitin deacetylase (PgdA/CDA1 family)
MRLAQRVLASALRPFTTARSRIPGTIACVETHEPVAALTFDDGPHVEHTPRVLDILDRHQAHGTFFLVGEMAQKHPELVRQLANAGHSVGNHSWDHPFFPSLSRRERWRQIRACERVLVSHDAARLFRPPYGAQSLAMRLDALCLGYKVVTWSVEAKDWRDDDPEQMARRLLDGMRPGSIVLLHDAIYRSRQAVPLYDRRAMLRALGLFLDRVRDRFRFVTVPELLTYGRPLCQAP